MYNGSTHINDIIKGKKIIEKLKILAIKKHTSAANLIEKAVLKMLNKDDQ